MPWVLWRPWRQINPNTRCASIEPNVFLWPMDLQLTVNVFGNQTDIFLVKFSKPKAFGKQEGFQPHNTGLKSFCSNSNITGM